ncbi:hypothetical protein [Rhodococcus spongiicola]|uniref:Uncharacterized protein n=1 Tax=Rhodococcus spongiicola TaxID=2487352 RepID=A0A438ASQ3_9NOCA|nr:hypothetical protein [Rhodococcus spongiicola]RVW01758.1 hypothetical protein EF834_15345 [Rhodococcus spongiicola]
MEQDPEPRAAHLSHMEIAGQIMIGIIAGPLFIVGFYQIAGRLWETLGGWGGPLYSGTGVVVAGSLVGIAHGRYPRFRALAWTAGVAAFAFYAWFQAVVVASLPGPDF